MPDETGMVGTDSQAAALEAVLIKGDLSALNEGQRLDYYRRVCESVGLNPLTQPFDYIKLNGRLVLYAKRDATEQLRKIHGVSITRLEKQFQGELYIVTAEARDKTGRTDCSTGAVTVTNLKGENLANAIMKAETKAKRRVTLSICGMGLLDETEVGTIAPAPEARGELAAPIAEQMYVEIAGLIVGEKQRDKYWWYKLRALDADGGEFEAFVKSPVETDSGRLAEKVNYAVRLKVEGTEKPNVYLLRDVLELKPVKSPELASGLENVPDSPPEAPKAQEGANAPQGKAFPEPPDTAEAKKKLGSQAMTISIQRLRKEIGIPDAAYYAILGTHGAEHATEVHSGKMFDGVMSELRQWAADQKGVQK